MSQKKDTIAQFLLDLVLDGCIVQAGTVDRVDVELTPRNYRAYLDAHQADNLYLLADVPAAIGLRRAGDKDIPRKHYIYLDFDLRKLLKQHGEEPSDTELKEIAVGILYVLDSHHVLGCWRYCVFTGNGIHLYYIGNPVAIRSLKHWRDGMRKFCEMVAEITAFSPDTGCINPARLSRIPGSYNVKDKRPIPTEILDRKDAVFDLSLIEALGKGTTEKSASQEINGEQSLSIPVPEGARNTTLTGIAGVLRRRGLDEQTLFAALQSINMSKCYPPLDEDEVRRIAQSVAKYPGVQTDAPKPQSSSAPVIVCLADVKAEKVGWLWQDRIPKGKLTLIEGDPGNGKSWCSLAIACAVTHGHPLPGDEERATQIAPAKVLLLIAEDGLADTIRPRLESMGANLSLVKIMTGVRDGESEERHLSLVNDLGAMEKALAEGGYALIIIDPLNAYLGTDLDTHKDSALRSVLTPLTKLVEKYGVALIGIRHLTKSSKDQPIYRGQGSIAYTAAARVVHLVGMNPNNERERVIACIKNNLAPFPLPLGFEIDDGRFLWRGVSEVSIDMLLKSGPSREKGYSALDEAVDFLQQALSECERPAAEVETEAEAAGISKTTLKRARLKMKIKPHREGFGEEGGWVWALPADAKEANSLNEDL